METESPTKEQIREFWEWCGFKLVNQEYFWKGHKNSFSQWYSPEGFVCNLPDNIDLNTLFKYALPKLISRGYGCTMSLDPLGANACTFIPFKLEGVESEGKAQSDPALALFWAIWELIHDR